MSKKNVFYCHLLGKKFLGGDESILLVNATPRTVSRCKGSPAHSTAFLGMVLCHGTAVR
jgi:hypothetical protein